MPPQKILTYTGKVKNSWKEIHFSLWKLLKPWPLHSSSVYNISLTRWLFSKLSRENSKKKKLFQTIQKINRLIYQFMDQITCLTLKEIYFHGKTGLSLLSLWTKFHPYLSSLFLRQSHLDLSLGVKKAIWATVLYIPKFWFHVENMSYGPSNPLIWSL